MNKTNKSIVFWLCWGILAALFLGSCSGQKKGNEDKSEQSSSLSSNDHPDSSSADELYERLMDSFSNDWMERESDPSLYPDYYGGSFVDEEGQFVVAVVGGVQAHKERLTEILGTDKFKLKTVEYSYRRMMGVMERIDAFLMDGNLTEESPLLTKFAGAYPDAKENRIKVLLSDTDNATIRLFKKEVVDSPLLVFEKGKVPEFTL